MAKKKGKKSKGQSFKADFGHKDAQSSGGRIRVPEGDYLVKSKKVIFKESQSGNPMLEWDLVFQGGKYDGKVIKTRTMLMPKSLWVLRNLLEAAGKKVPTSMVSMKTSQLEGLEFGITCTDDEYNNRIYSEVSDFISPDLIADSDESGGDDFEDEESDDDDFDDEDDDDEDDEDEDLEEVDLDDL